MYKTIKNNFSGYYSPLILLRKRGLSLDQPRKKYTGSPRRIIPKATRELTRSSGTRMTGRRTRRMDTSIMMMGMGSHTCGDEELLNDVEESNTAL